MATSKIQVTEGSGKNVATNSFTEDAVTKDVGRQVLNDSSGNELKGQAAMAASVPVVIASNQSAVPASQSGTWTVQPGNTANTTAWKVDGSAVTQPVSEADGTNVTLGAKADAKSTATDTTAITVMQVLKQISASVQAPPSQAVTNAGTFVVQAAISGTWTVGSNSATGSAVPANAFYNGGIAKTSLPTAATDGNLTGLMSDKYGRLVIINDGIRDIVAMQTTTISASTAETTVGTAVASTFLDLTSVLISNTSATAARVDFRDTTAGSVLFSVYVPAGDTRGIVFHTPAPQTTVNTNWTAQSSASVTDLRIMMKWVKNK